MVLDYLIATDLVVAKVSRVSVMIILYFANLFAAREKTTFVRLGKGGVVDST